METIGWAYGAGTGGSAYVFRTTDGGATARWPS